MTAQHKLEIRRWTIRQLRKLLDFLDDRLHTAEVQLREDLAVSGKNSPVRLHREPSARAKAEHGCRGLAGGRVAGVSVAGCNIGNSESPLRDVKDSARPPQSETFAEWEARRSGVAPIPRPRHHRGISATEFNRRLANEMEAIFGEDGRA